jgi:hypothetical protein
MNCRFSNCPAGGGGALTVPFSHRRAGRTYVRSAILSGVKAQERRA